MFKKSILFSCATLAILNIHTNLKCEELRNQHIALQESLHPHMNDIQNNITN